MGAKESRTHTAGVSLVCQLEIDNSDQIVTGSTAIRSMQEKIPPFYNHEMKNEVRRHRISVISLLDEIFLFIH